MNDFIYYFGVVMCIVFKFKCDGKEIYVVIVSCIYDIIIDDLWDVLIIVKCILCWFMLVEGELKFGGCYQFKGNVGGEIIQCELLCYLVVIWEFCGNVSWVDVMLEFCGQDIMLFIFEYIVEVLLQFWE